MPITETVVVNISCDNPDCPGNTLSPTSRSGWVFTSSQIDGTSHDHVYCSHACINMVTSSPVTAQRFGLAKE